MGANSSSKKINNTTTKKPKGYTSGNLKPNKDGTVNMPTTDFRQSNCTYGADGKLVCKQQNPQKLNTQLYPPSVSNY